MLELTVTGEYYDEESDRFIAIEPKQVQLEHSLLTVSAWESKWKKPFLSHASKSIAESIDYIRCMLQTDCTDLEFGLLVNGHFQEINAYINSSQTATSINRPVHGKTSRENVTSELIYYWMFAAGIPAQPCETWHLSRLLMLIEIFGIKNAPKKRMKRGDISKMYRSLNAQRRAQMGTEG